MDVYTRHEHYTRQPCEVSIETRAVCNAACTFCPYPTLDRHGAELSLETLKSLADQMSDWQLPFVISPFKVNEPLLDPRLMHICRLFTDRVPRASLRLFTNGSPLTRLIAYHIAELPRVTHLWISLNSVDPDEYFQLMRLRFSNTLRRLDDLHHLKTIGCFPHDVCVSKVTDGILQNDFTFTEFCVNRWPLFRPIIIKRDGWLGYVDPYDPTIPDTPCARWFELSILATGTAALCCMDATGKFSMGNVHTDKLLDIYNQPFYLDRRQYLTSRKFIYPCKTCTY